MTGIAIFLFTGSLILLLAASLPTFLEVMKHGNSVDPLRREIEEEKRRKEKDSNAA